MNPGFAEQLLSLYEFRSSAQVSCLHDGENSTYRFQDARRDLAIRIFRPRFALAELRAEAAWLEALALNIGTPSVVRNRHGDSISVLSADPEVNSRHCLATVYIDGHKIDRPDHHDYERLGRTLRQLHFAACKILSDYPSDWIGRQRPTYSAQSVVKFATENLDRAAFLKETTKQQLRNLGNQIITSLAPYPADSFVHADLHFGNLLVSKRQWWCLDFDECGFGYQAFDMGIIRTFMHATNELDAYWPAFAKGYEDCPDLHAIAAASALRIFFMMGKIPLRLDLPQIRTAPESYIVRYMDYANAELQAACNRRGGEVI